jgi:hypothetical protein
MGIIEFIVIAAVLGFLAWLAITYIPMPAPVRTVIIVAVSLVIVVILLRAIGFGDIIIPRMR